MSKMIKLEGGNFHHAFQCPACGNMHGIDDRWTWNGDVEKPTITPSILVTIGHHPDPPDVCHSFVTEGRIQFLGDCTHALAGQTVPLEDV